MMDGRRDRRGRADGVTQDMVGQANAGEQAHRVMVKFVRFKGLLASAQSDAAGIAFFDRLGNPMAAEGEGAGFASRFAIALKAGFAAAASADGGQGAAVASGALALAAAASDAGFELDSGEAAALISWIGTGGGRDGEDAGRLDLAAFRGDGAHGDGEAVFVLGSPDRIFGLADFPI